MTDNNEPPENRCYEGRVIEVSGQTFTADLIDLLEDKPSVHADFPMRVLRNAERVEPGDIIDIVKQGDGFEVRVRDLGKWTEEGLAAVAEAALQKWSALFD